MYGFAMESNWIARERSPPLHIQWSAANLLIIFLTIRMTFFQVQNSVSVPAKGAYCIAWPHCAPTYPKN